MKITIEFPSNSTLFCVQTKDYFMRLFLLGLLFSFSAHASVQVAFLILKDANGNIVQFEEGGRYGHVAVSYKGQWLHAHPTNGVELTHNLSDIGWISVILESDQFYEPTEEYVNQNLGKAFSYLKSWEDTNYTYCAKLLAEPLKVKPLPMNFAATMWQSRTGLPRGEKGLSADDLYKVFTGRGFRVKQVFKEQEPTLTQIQMRQAK